MILLIFGLFCRELDWDRFGLRFLMAGFWQISIELGYFWQIRLKIRFFRGLRRVLAYLLFLQKLAF